MGGVVFTISAGENLSDVTQAEVMPSAVIRDQNHQTEDDFMSVLNTLAHSSTL